MISARAVELRAGARLLLEAATFQVSPGDKIGLVGRNGAGKTTLARVLAAEALPAAGQVVTGGSVGYLPQDTLSGELDALARALPESVDALAVGGRIVVEAYQSLEDRMVKRTFAAGATSSAPPDLPVEQPEHAPYLRLLTRGAEQAGDDEVARNPRAQSVRLRAAERVRPTPTHVARSAA